MLREFFRGNAPLITSITKAHRHLVIDGPHSGTMRPVVFAIGRRLKEAKYEYRSRHRSVTPGLMAGHLRPSQFGSVR